MIKNSPERTVERKRHTGGRSSSASNPGTAVGTLASNRKAFYDYAVLDSIEAGIALNGSEVKSIRAGTASIKDAVVIVDHGEMWLYNAHIPLWPSSALSGYEPLRKRKLLLHRREIDTLMGKAKEKYLTLIPLKIYGTRGRIKVQVGLCKGKKQYEKREVERERQLKRELHEEKRKYMV
jgi:SsrA-binding protein